MVIDYSKWDNIDTDSEPEDQAQDNPNPSTSSSPGANPVAQEGTLANASATDNAEASQRIKAVVSRGDSVPGPKFAVTTVPRSHPIFDLEPAPISALVELPLVSQRISVDANHRGNLDNQMITYLNIDPDSGFAPPHWQSRVGNVLVARKDRKPLLAQHLEGLWMYCDKILDRFGDGEGAPRKMYNKNAFKEWLATYQEETSQYRPDWVDVKSPFES